VTATSHAGRAGVMQIEGCVQQTPNSRPPEDPSANISDGNLRHRTLMET
jgi:hypothetical protein